MIRIKSQPFKVIGVMAPKGQSGMGPDMDDQILAPYTTVMKKLAGQTNIRDVTVSAASATDTSGVADRIALLFRTRHKIVPGQDEDFFVRTAEEIADIRTAAMGTMTTLLAGIAGVSLIVGGIGIMNIMLVSVTERTREIGLRMAIGAKGHDVLLQFLVEALALSLLGGGIGIALLVASAWPKACRAGCPGRPRFPPTRWRWRSALPQPPVFSSGSIPRRKRRGSIRLTRSGSNDGQRRHLSMREPRRKTYVVGEVEVRALRGVTLDACTRGEFLAVTGPSGSGQVHADAHSRLPRSPDVGPATSSTAKTCPQMVARPAGRRCATPKSDSSFRASISSRARRRSTMSRCTAALSRRQSCSRASERHKLAVEALTARSASANAPTIIRNQLSGGQQQRTNGHRPRADHASRRSCWPTSPPGNLDTRTSVEVMGIFQRLNVERGITVLLITHEMRHRQNTALASSTSPRRPTSWVPINAVAQPARRPDDELKALPIDEETVA